MKKNRLFRVLAVALTLALLLVMLPVHSVLADAYTVLVENIDDPLSEYYEEAEGQPGDRIHVWGTGPADQEIDVYFSSQNASLGDDIDDEVTAYELLTNALVNGLSETFNLTTIFVPDELSDGDDDEDIHGGVYYIYITKYDDEYIRAKATFEIVDIAQAEIDIDEGIVGDEVEISGEGFAPDEDITVKFDNDNITEDVDDPYADQYGDILFTFEIPEGIYGDHTITVIGEESLAEVELEFTIEPNLIINPVEGETDTQVTVYGTGFDYRNDVNIYFGSTKVAEAETNRDGTFGGGVDVVTFTVPTAGVGTYTVLAEDVDDDDISDTAQFSVTTPPLNPAIELNTDSGNVGDTITVTGEEFTPDDEVTIYFNGDEVATEDTDEDGEFTVTFDVPESPAGEYDIEAEDGDELSATETFSVEPEMTMTPLTGVVEDEITVSGTGFDASTAITILYGTAAIAPNAAITTNPNGTFSGTFDIPALPGGNRTLTITDGTNSLTAVLAVEASVIINPNSGAVGDGVGLAGYGFGASRTISVLFNGAQVTLLTPVMTDENGVFGGAQFYVPASPGGAATITVSDGTNSVPVGFTVEPSVDTNDTTSATSPGSVGDSITISGSGYAASVPVVITYASDPVTLYASNTNSNGSFTATITIPASAAGEHTITVKVNGVEVEQYTFFMESTPPSPKPSLSAVYFGSKAEEPIVFDWGEVTDDSMPVTYNLVIYTITDTVETTVLEFTGLEDTDYTLTEAEALKLVPLEGGEYYYWHVQAVDAAGNAGSWSDADTFTIGGGGIGWPSWLTWLLVGLGSLVVFIFAIWLGRRLAFSSY